MSSRPDGRAPDELRPVRCRRRYLDRVPGSVLWEQGGTRVLCAASWTRGVPRWRKGSGQGWLTAEYGMLPSATTERGVREAKTGRQGGRTMEIQRLIGRVLRAGIDLAALGENTVTLDCDVLQADGGTRAAAVCGAFVALRDACDDLRARGRLKADPLHGQLAAVSVGIVRGRPVLDLDYAEDAEAETDLNVAMNDAGGLIELQGTAEGHAFRRPELDAMLDLADAGIRRLLELQRQARAE